MSCSPPKLIVMMCVVIALCGCHPIRPVYLNDFGDRSYYLDQATDIEYPDVQSGLLPEATQTRAPITVTNAKFDSFWDLTLEEVVAIALQNSKVIRGYGTPSLQGQRVAPGIDSLANGPAGAGTLYDVAIRESEPGIIGRPGQLPLVGSLVTNTGLDANQGVEAALADFDAHLTSSLIWDRQDQPRNVIGNGLIFQPDVFVQDGVTWQTELAKRTANGTNLFFRNVNSYTKNNVPASVQPLESVYQSALEWEVRQPLLRGRGTFINRMPVVVSRIGTDQAIANLEAQLQNMVTNVEIRYWELHCAYRLLETARDGRDAALETYRSSKLNYEAGRIPTQDIKQAEGQLNTFKGQVELAFADLLTAEGNLRWLMGPGASDGRLIRPIDEPTKAHVVFDWDEVLNDALTHRPELRQERWEVKKRELGLAYAKNSLLPNLNATGLYRWTGLGDQFASYRSNVPQFPNNRSGALNELFDGNYQEFQLGLEFGMPVGFRRERSNVRNAELKLAVEIARLEEMEIDVTKEVTDAIRALDANFQLARSNLAAWASYSEELAARQKRYEAGQVEVTFLLDAQRTRAISEAAYYQSLCEYNKLIALIHRRKGTILFYSSVAFGEGAWPEKAYCDADEHARRRGASRHVDFGWTRPEVISRGTMAAPQGDGDSGIIIDDPSIYYDPSQPLEELPGQTPTPAELPPGDALPSPGGQNPDLSRPLTDVQVPSVQALVQAPPVTAMQPEPYSHSSTQRARQFDWQRFGLSKPPGPRSTTEAVIRQVNYEEEIKQ